MKSQNLADKVELQKLDEEMQRAQGEAFQAEQALNALKHDRSLRTERFGYFDEQIARFTQEILEDEVKLNYLQEHIKTLAAKQAVLKQTVEESHYKVADQEPEA